MVAGCDPSRSPWVRASRVYPTCVVNCRSRQARDRCLTALARDTRDRRRTNEPLAVVSTNDLKQRNLEGHTAMSSSAKTAPYGSWKSPITSDLIVAQSISLSDVRLDGGQIYWLEGRPQEQGRSVVVRADADGRRIDVTPAPSNVRTRVHEYGGGAWTVWDGTIYFSNFADGRLYRQAPDGSAPRPLTPEPPARDRQWRFADGVIDQRRNRWIGVREDHTRRRRAGQCHRRRRSRRRSRGRSRAGARARFLRLAAALARRKPARLAGVGSPQHAVERHAALPCRHRRPRRAS